jgi:GntR family transcriptional regulator
MPVPPFKPTPLRLMYEQVAEHVAARIEAGELAPGSKLPPERELASEYGVAYNTMRSAMQILRDRGLVVTMHGRGTYVAERDSGAPRQP